MHPETYLSLHHVRAEELQRAATRRAAARPVADVPARSVAPTLLRSVASAVAVTTAAWSRRVADSVAGPEVCCVAG